jgi:hypothetical protein
MTQMKYYNHASIIIFGLASLYLGTGEFLTIQSLVCLAFLLPQVGLRETGCGDMERISKSCLCRPFFLYPYDGECVSRCESAQVSGYA